MARIEGLSSRAVCSINHRFRGVGAVIAAVFSLQARLTDNAGPRIDKPCKGSRRQGTWNLCPRTCAHLREPMPAEPVGILEVGVAHDQRVPIREHGAGIQFTAKRRPLKEAKLWPNVRRILLNKTPNAPSRSQTIA